MSAVRRHELQGCYGGDRCVRLRLRVNGWRMPFCEAHWAMLPAALQAAIHAVVTKEDWTAADMRAFETLRSEARRVITTKEEAGA